LAGRRFSIGEDTSLNFVANISGTWVLVVTNACFSETTTFFGGRISDTFNLLARISSNAVFLALTQAWIAIFVVDQNSSASLGRVVTDSILAVNSKVVVGSPFSTISFKFANWSITSLDSFVEGVDTSFDNIARIVGAFVFVITILS
jgi:hypothetical protein